MNYELARECSTLDFNLRVLHQCKLDKNPLGEKFNFLKISTTNLDEFIRVRLTKYLNENSIDTYNGLINHVKRFYQPQYDMFKYLISQIDNVKFIESIDNVTTFMKNEYKRVFRDNLKLVKDPKKIKSDMLYFIINKKIFEYTSNERFVDISNNPSTIIYVPVENLLKINGDSVIAFRVFRDAYININDLNDKNILEDFKMKIITRQFNDIIAVEFDTTGVLDPSIFSPILDITSDHIFTLHSKIPALGMCIQMVDELKLDTFDSFKFNKPKVKNKTNIFDAIDKGDVLLSHPFDDYSTVIRLLEESVKDEKTTEIYQTLYRVSSEESPIVKALCLAAKNKIKVSVLVEIKARFSEETNFKVIEKLEEAGVNIILPTSKYKVHCKTMLIVKGKKMYAHIGTGNYNEKTACVYTDLSLLTSSKNICNELKRMFKMLELKNYDGEYSSIVCCPGTIRETLMNELIKLDKIAKKGNKAVAEIKVNSIADPIIIDKLYESANNGVEIKIICRGTCIIQPNKNIKITSVVGRYLEHSRIYRFKSNNHDKIYISSADLLTRNLERRVELLCKINNEVAKEKIRKILKAYFKDEQNTFVRTKTKYVVREGKSSVYDVFRKDMFNETIKIKAKKKKNKKEFQKFTAEIIQTALCQDQENLFD